MNGRAALAACVVVTFGMLWGMLAIARDEALVRVSANPRIAIEPVTLHVQVIIPRHEDNRRARVQADSADFGRASEWQLDGDKAPMATNLWWRDLPGGEYQIIAEVAGVRGRYGRATTSVSIIGRR